MRPKEEAGAGRGQGAGVAWRPVRGARASGPAGEVLSPELRALGRRSRGAEPPARPLLQPSCCRRHASPSTKAPGRGNLADLGSPLASRVLRGPLRLARTPAAPGPGRAPSRPPPRSAPAAPARRRIAKGPGWERAASGDSVLGYGEATERKRAESSCFSGFLLPGARVKKSGVGRRAAARTASWTGCGKALGMHSDVGCLIFGRESCQVKDPRGKVGPDFFCCCLRWVFCLF